MNPKKLGIGFHDKALPGKENATLASSKGKNARVAKSTLSAYFLSGCAASSGEGVPIWLIAAII
jgi:hypothetical protein